MQEHLERMVEHEMDLLDQRRIGRRNREQMVDLALQRGPALAGQGHRGHAARLCRGERRQHVA
jgi:hypothetical protein